MKYKITVTDDTGTETGWSIESDAGRQAVQEEMIQRLLGENSEQKRMIAALRDEAEPAMREHFLTRLLWGVPPDEVIRRLEMFGLVLDQSMNRAAIVFEVDADPNEVSAVPSPAHIMRIISEGLVGRCKSLVFLGTLTVVAITAWDTPGHSSELIGIVNEICSKCMKSLELVVTAGIGHCYDGLGKLHESFLEARAALEYKSIAGTGKAIYIDDVQRGQTPYASPGSNLFSAVRFGSVEQIAMHIADIEHRLVGCDEWERQANTFSLFNEAYRIIARYELYNEPSVTDILDKLGAPPPELTELFQELCLCMSRHIQSRRERAPHSLAEEAKRFIDLHYHESGLSVERLCEYLHVSQSYFSTVFKHETGSNYVQYLTELRMNRAVALLQQTDERTYVIAAKVGYEDPNYFSYVFKKHFGVSPVKYRKTARELGNIE